MNSQIYTKGSNIPVQDLPETAQLWKPVVYALLALLVNLAQMFTVWQQVHCIKSLKIDVAPSFYSTTRKELPSSVHLLNACTCTY